MCAQNSDFPIATPSQLDETDLSDSKTRVILSRVQDCYEALSVEETQKAFAELSAVLDGLANAVICTLDQIAPYLSKMQSLLSQRGEERQSILKLAGLPSWTAYAEAFAVKLGCSLRSIQRYIKDLRDEGEPTSRSDRQCRRNQAKPTRLDARQQSALVKAQLAINDLVAALKNGGDWETPLAEYEKVAVTPAKLDSFVNALNPEPEWKNILARLMATLEQHGQRLPVPVLKEMRVIQKSLSSGSTRDSVAPTESPLTKHYKKEEKQDSEGATYWAVIAEGEKSAWSRFDVESDADKMLETLNSPVMVIAIAPPDAKSPIDGSRPSCDLGITRIDEADMCRQDGCGGDL